MLSANEFHETNLPGMLIRKQMMALRTWRYLSRFTHLFRWHGVWELVQSILKELFSRKDNVRQVSANLYDWEQHRCLQSVFRLSLNSSCWLSYCFGNVYSAAQDEVGLAALLRWISWLLQFVLQFFHTISQVHGQEQSSSQENKNPWCQRIKWQIGTVYFRRELPCLVSIIHSFSAQ